MIGGQGDGYHRGMDDPPARSLCRGRPAALAGRALNGRKGIFFTERGWLALQDDWSIA